MCKQCSCGKNQSVLQSRVSQEELNKLFKIRDALKILSDMDYKDNNALTMESQLINIELKIESLAK